MSEKIMFHIQNLKYKDVLRIKELDIPEGGLTCIIGESGSGKTTLLKMLNHLISPDSGDIEVMGRSVFKWNPVQLRRKIAMLSQSPVMFQGTVRDNLLIGLHFAEKPAAPEDKLAEMLKWLNLHISLDADSESLSGGEKQRVALARVLLTDPAVLLLDEPSSALDEETARAILGKLKDYGDSQKKTIIMVTHSSDLVRNFSENTIKIERGQFAEEAEKDAQQ
ncbi:ABC transporter ATP-binding protein [Sporolactobacillus shoreae]|nr:ABC transporter ATP-binding protein [Sporolactobacillus shoreae]